MTKTRKRVCPRCGRSRWRNLDFYTPSATYCKECSREYERERYNRTKKVPDGPRYNSKGQLVMHQGHGVKILWTDQMLADLRRWYPTTKNEELAGIFGIGRRTLRTKAKELQLQKDKKWVLGIRRQNMRQAIIFSKIAGHPSAAKKGEHRSPATEFKPGNKIRATWCRAQAAAKAVTGSNL